ncbi:MAG: pgk, phosphoglycerate kinase [Candidatus Saccharibacteria bacterium]|nr:pgk, phosphoglycerate kinase [Candidatus Saccharibacteria bacterium]
MGFFKQTIRDVPLDGQTVLVRADYNVPLQADGTIDDDFRIRASLPTIRALRERGCKVVIISHLGRPEGKDASLSLESIGQRLAALLEKEVLFVGDCVGDKVYQVVRHASPSSIILLENLRFYPGEEADDEAFAKKVAQATNASYFIQDGFGVVHRAHASTHAITLLLPSVAGLLLEKEYTTITNAMRAPARPLVAVMGGAKVSDKIKVIKALVDEADTIVVSGAMANTFLTYRGLKLGKSKVEPDQSAILDEIYAAVEKKVGENRVDDFLMLPVDLAVSSDFANSERREVPADSLSDDDMALDVGKRTIEKVDAIVAAAKTVIWNGTLGVSEFSNFAHGSARLALALATHPEIESIVGGGDTVDFVLKWDARHGESFGHVSTGGGASLELMAGDPLPGVESLLDAKR